MNFQEIENEALHLSERDRAELAQSLLISLDEPTEPNQISTEWLTEAQQRSGELDRGIVQPVSSENTHKVQPMDVAFLRGPEGTLGEWASEADEEASREAIKKLLHKTRGSMKLGKTPDDIDAEIRIMRDEWERTWE
uniref:Addiction module component n=1 Tax=Candidatus Kentrum sp. UNK TaxID=2126344 RepID=A0A451AJ54_9GAMM|nr:MAG: Putative addiction module component [Candidatus Kentron sp. UNK]VFK69383.1 MAG: Putative addiction module component [Candidatus Kentron sp. UNK]